jgi:hypothetical protein
LAGQRVRRRDLKIYPRLDVAPLVNRHLGIVEPPISVSEPDWSYPLRAPLSTNSVTAGWELLRSSDAYLIYPVSVTSEFERAGITALEVEDRPRDTVDIGLYTLSDITQNDIIGAFLDILKQQDRSGIVLS